MREAPSVESSNNVDTLDEPWNGTEPL